MGASTGGSSGLESGGAGTEEVVFSLGEVQSSAQKPSSSSSKGCCGFWGALSLPKALTCLGSHGDTCRDVFYCRRGFGLLIYLPYYRGY